MRSPFAATLFAGLLLCTFHRTAHGQTTSATDAFQYVLPLEGRYINDHCLVQAPDGRWHLFCILGEISSAGWERDGNEVMIGHFSSPDLLQWEEHDPAITIGPDGSYDDGHVYAPYVIVREGTYYMYYTATAASHFSAERICLATSRDLFTWEKSPENPVFVADTSWAAYYPEHRSGGYGPISCRDPHVMQHPRYGYIMYYVARLKNTDGGPALAAVAAATSSDLVSWTDRGPVLIREITGQEEFNWSHPESPCVFERNGRFYLFWKGSHGTHYAISQNPLDFRHVNTYFFATSHASEIVNWDGTWYMTSCSRKPDDPYHDTDRTQGLYLAGLEWTTRWPKLVSLATTDVGGTPQWPVLDLR